MSDRIDVIVQTDEVSIVGPPEVVRVQYDIGPVGRRGSQWLTGSGLPSELTIPNYDQLLINDLYLDSASGTIYQYILLPSNSADWVIIGSLNGSSTTGSIPVYMQDTEPIGPALWIDTTNGDMTMNIVTGA